MKRAGRLIDVPLLLNDSAQGACFQWTAGDGSSVFQGKLPANVFPPSSAVCPPSSPSPELTLRTQSANQRIRCSLLDAGDAPSLPPAPPSPLAYTSVPFSATPPPFSLAHSHRVSFSSLPLQGGKKKKGVSNRKLGK